MSTKTIFTFQIIAGGLLLSLLGFGCSSSDKDKTPTPLEGLWEITKTINLELPDEDLPEDGDPAEADPEGEGTPEGAAQLKNAETDSDSQELVDGAYLHLSSTSYRYFTLSEGVEQGLSSGSYLREGSALTFIAANEDTTRAEILELSATRLKLEISLGEGLQEWTLARVEGNSLPQEDDEEDTEEEKSEYVDYEAEFHDPEAPEGSLFNPLALTEEHLNQDLEGILYYSDEFSNPPMAESYYFLKTDTVASYRLTITVLEANYDHQLFPQKFMRYVQLWVATRPDSDHFKADSKRIEEGQENEPFVYEGLKTPSGFLYLRLFSLQDGIRYQLKLEKEEAEQTETDAGEGDAGEH